MASRPARVAVSTFLLLLAGACTSVPPPPALNVAQLPAIRLAVQSVEVGSLAEYPANMNFIARRRSEQLAADAQQFLHSRLEATGGSDVARATVQEASLIERARPAQESTGGFALAEPDWEMVGVLGVKVALVDGLGVEQSAASSRVEIKRSISRGASVESKDNFARTLTNDLIQATSAELEKSIDQNLAAVRAP